MQSGANTTDILDIKKDNDLIQSNEDTIFHKVMPIDSPNLTNLYKDNSEIYKSHVDTIDNTHNDEHKSKIRSERTLKIGDMYCPPKDYNCFNLLLLSTDVDKELVFSCKTCNGKFKNKTKYKTHETYCKKSKKNPCYRCGRDDHYATNCFALTDIDGQKFNNDTNNGCHFM